MSRPTRAAGAAAIIFAVAVSLAACTHHKAAVSSSPSGSPSASSGESSSSTGDSSAPTGPATLSAPTSPTGSASASAANGSGCPAARLKITATRLPGAAGSNYALLVFTNSGPASCTLTGYPDATLLDGSNNPLGQPATHAAGTVAPIVLAPGASASTLIKDESSVCQTDTRSTSVRVTAPGAASDVVLALVLPPCALSVQPVIAGTNPSP